MPHAFDPQCALIPCDVMKIADGLGIPGPVATVGELVSRWGEA